MATFDMRVREYMKAPVLSVTPDTRLTAVQAMLVEGEISCLPVLDGTRPVGVISRTDLLRTGRGSSGDRYDRLVSLPDTDVARVMTPGVLTVSADDTVSFAASLMVTRGMHRVFVQDGETLVGVFSTRDVTEAIRDRRVEVALSMCMSTPLFTVDVDETIEVATERLARARVSGVVVLDAGWPVGLFTQVDALRYRAWEPDTPVDEVMNTALLCLPCDTRLHRVASQVLAMRVRRVIAVEARAASGILTGLDFARAAAL